MNHTFNAMELLRMKFWMSSTALMKTVSAKVAHVSLLGGHRLDVTCESSTYRNRAVPS
jgi:hypothetical protein